MTKTERKSLKMDQNPSEWNYVKRVLNKGGNVTEFLVKFVPYKGQKAQCWSMPLH